LDEYVQRHERKLDLKYAEAVFASGGKFGYLTDAPEWDEFLSLLIGDVWRPPQRAVVSFKYINIVYNKHVADVNAVLAASSGGCLQFDGWTDGPKRWASLQRNVRCSAPISYDVLYNSRLRETAEKAMSSIKDVMTKLLPPIAMMSADSASWTEAKTIGVVTDSSSVMRKARATMLDDNMLLLRMGARLTPCRIYVGMS
jgi:hypothetical protein